MTSFAFWLNGSTLYSDPELGLPQGTIHLYNYMLGLAENGAPFIDPNTNDPTQYTLSGDPVAGTGWYEGAGWPGGPGPSDMRNLISSGPFTMAPGDTQEVAIAIFLAQGSDNIQSVAALKDRALEIQNYYGAYTITDVKDVQKNTVNGFELMQNYPNPFNPTTTIKYTIPNVISTNGRNLFVTLKVYDVLGNEVATLINEEKSAGSYSINFDGSRLSSGIYFYKLTAGGYTATKKLIMLK
jgi:hypothetical protein